MTLTVANWLNVDLTIGLMGLNPFSGSTGAWGWKNVSPIWASLLFLIPHTTKPTWPANLSSKYNCKSTAESNRIMCRKGIHGCVLLDTLKQYPWMTLDWYLIINSVDTWLTSQSTVGWESADFGRHAIECSLLIVSWLSTDCWSSVDWDVDWVSVGYHPSCWLSADREHWSTLDTWSVWSVSLCLK